MDVTTGKVVDGKIVVEGESLPEGKTVGVFLPGDKEAYELSPEEAVELDKAIDEVKAGRFVDGDGYLYELRRKP